MRRALLALLILAVAGPALGAAKVPATPKPKPVPVQATPDAAAAAVLPAPIPLAAARPGGDPLQCKAACAKTLYFCSSGGEDDGCGSRWAQCNASCSTTYAAPRFGR